MLAMFSQFLVGFKTGCHGFPSVWFDRRAFVLLVSLRPPGRSFGP